jgi:tetratricopeptide (TPR) repeat protein
MKNLLYSLCSVILAINSTIPVESFCMPALNINTDSTLSKYYFEQGQRNLKNQEFTIALENFNKVIDIDSDYNMVHYYRGKCYFHLGEFKK